MHIRHFAASNPTKPALILARSGTTVTFLELERRSNRGAHLLREYGLQTGDTIALLLENHERYLEIAWAAQRSGLYFTCISTRLLPAEIHYIVQDSGARLLVTSRQVLDASPALAESFPHLTRFLLGGAAPGFRDWDAEAARQPQTPIPDERAGTDMLYSSGTTGRPKGIEQELPADGNIDSPTPVSRIAESLLGFGPETIYLCPAPLYHAAPLRYAMATQRLGGTVVLMDRFDPCEALEAIERYRISHAQWVPTHFVRMLKLDEATRKSFDLSSLRVAIHAAAPCPVEVKRAMLEWWGPILVEYYSGTEGNGLTMIGSEEWLRRPGSVGQAKVGILHICGEDGEELPVRNEGLIYFEGGYDFSYHNDPDKTREARNSHGWTSLGDIGWVDEDGYLYLTDRKSFTIISGGVNIYPQEIENALVLHPAVMDAAVIGAPDAEMGERIVAVVQPVDWRQAGPELAGEIREWLRERVSKLKIPSQIDFMPELPRQPTGKLYKRLLRDRYWSAPGTSAIERETSGEQDARG